MTPTPAPAPVPVAGRRLEPDTRREEILAAAARLFGERPFASVPTSEIAAAAGVTRGLLHHYFGTKRELYLEVVRRFTTISDAAVDELPAGSPEQRAGAAVDWFLDTVDRHRGMWIAVGTGTAGDADLDAILAEADEAAVDRVLRALAAAPTPLLRARVRSFFGLVRSASREWIVRGALDRAQTHELLTTVLLAVLDVPAVPSTT